MLGDVGKILMAQASKIRVIPESLRFEAHQRAGVCIHRRLKCNAELIVQACLFQVAGKAAFSCVAQIKLIIIRDHLAASFAFHIVEGEIGLLQQLVGVGHLRT